MGQFELSLPPVIRGRVRVGANLEFEISDFRFCPYYPGPPPGKPEEGKPFSREDGLFDDAADSFMDGARGGDDELAVEIANAGGAAVLAPGVGVDDFADEGDEVFTALGFGFVLFVGGGVLA